MAIFLKSFLPNFIFYESFCRISRIVTRTEKSMRNESISIITRIMQNLAQIPYETIALKIGHFYKNFFFMKFIRSRYEMQQSDVKQLNFVEYLKMYCQKAVYAF